VEHLQPLLVHKAFFTHIHTADTDLPNHSRIDGWRGTANAGEHGGAMTTQHGHRHAVHVAAGCELCRVEVGVGIEPEYAELFACVTAVACDCTDRTNAQAMVTAQHHGQG